SESSPPQLFAISRSGEQNGSLGSYCWRNFCADAIGVPLPAAPLQVKPGELLGLRSQYGPDAASGLTPTSFSAGLYPYDKPPGQVAELDGTAYFTPKGQPVYSTGPAPGRPFS